VEPQKVTETLTITNWRGPFDSALQARALEALEDGRVLVMPHLHFVVTSGETPFSSQGALDKTRKNISFDPATGACHGTALTGEDLTRLSGMMQRFAADATAFVHALLPGYVTALERARTSFRPAEITGREYSPRKDDRRLHVDAFPTRPMGGRRILRVFTNIAPDDTSRVWLVGEPFEDFAAKFLPRVRASLPGEAWILAQLGLTKGRRSRYDQIMLGLHDAAKQDDTYQTGAPRTELSFPPGTTWMCFTDQVLHAATAGRFALEQTFHLPVQVMARSDRAPLRVLERLSGKRLS
jgi:hypothetical protein